MSPREGKRDARPSDVKVERVVYAIVLAVLMIVPLLAFVFSFGNVGRHGVELGAGKDIAYFTGPAVDLSVTGLIVAATWLSHRGWTEKQLWPVHLTSIACGLIMFWLNCGEALMDRFWRLAIFDAVGPFLLIVMGFVGPWLLRQLAEAKTAGAGRPSTGEGRVAKAAKPPTSTANPAAAPTPTDNDNPAPVDNRQNDKASVAKTKPAAKPSSDRSGGAVEIHAAAMLPVYRQMLKDTGKRPSARDLAAALPDIGGESRQKQIRAEVEQRWFPEMMPKFRVIEGGDPLQETG